MKRGLLCLLLGCSPAQPQAAAAQPLPTATPSATASAMPTATESATVTPTTTAAAPLADAEARIALLRLRFKSCYNRGLSTDPNMTGRMMLLLDVGPDGNVRDVSKVSGSGLSSDVEQCLMNIARTAVFAPPGGSGAKLQVPLTFMPASAVSCAATYASQAHAGGCVAGTAACAFPEGTCSCEPVCTGSSGTAPYPASPVPHVWDCTPAACGTAVAGATCAPEGTHCGRCSGPTLDCKSGKWVARP